MSTTYSIRVDEKTKKKFLKEAKKRGFEGATIIRIFMETYIKNPNIITLEVDEDAFDEALKLALTDKEVQEAVSALFGSLGDIEKGKYKTIEI